MQKVKFKIIALRVLYDLLAFVLLGVFLRVGVGSLVGVLHQPTVPFKFNGVEFLTFTHSKFEDGIFLLTITLLSIFCCCGVYLCVERFIKGIVFYTLKSVFLYHLAEPENSLKECFVGVTKCYKSTIFIPTANKIIRKSLDQLGDIVTNVDIHGTLENAFRFIEDNTLVKLGKPLIHTALDYIDECILTYCYKHKELGLLEGAKEAIKIFIAHAPKMILTSLSLFSIKVMCEIICFTLWVSSLVKFHLVTFLPIVLSYCVYKGITFIVNDAILEPLLLSHVINTFLALEGDLDSISLIEEVEHCLEGLADVIRVGSDSNAEQEQALSELNREQDRLNRGGDTE